MRKIDGMVWDGMGWDGTGVVVLIGFQGMSEGSDSEFSQTMLCFITTYTDYSTKLWHAGNSSD